MMRFLTGRGGAVQDGGEAADRLHPVRTGKMPSLFFLQKDEPFLHHENDPFTETGSGQP
jgi:hypothetical protein